MDQKPENVIIRPNERKTKMAELNFGEVVLCCANYCQMLSAVQLLFGHINDTKINVELYRHYEIFTVIWYFNVLSIFTPSLIHLSDIFPNFTIETAIWGASIGRNGEKYVFSRQICLSDLRSTFRSSQMAFSSVKLEKMPSIFWASVGENGEKYMFSR